MEPKAMTIEQLKAYLEECLQSPDGQMEEQFSAEGYINASYVYAVEPCKDAYSSPSLDRSRVDYIAAQAPLKRTVADFWQMVAENRVTLIVMLTELNEGGTSKSAKYWPDEVYATTSHVWSGNELTVTLIAEQDHPSFVIRTLSLVSALNVDEPVTVTQIQMKSWPDHGVPDVEEFAALIDEYRRLKDAEPPGHGPSLIHCSAGIGRSGIFIAADVIRRQLEKGVQYFDIQGTVLQLRTCRMHMVEKARPKCFDADANSPDATTRWNHRFQTFQTFLGTVESPNLNKLETLIHFVDAPVYVYIADCPDYESAISTLEKLYVRPKNIIYAHHLLQTCKQDTSQGVDQFVQRLKSLAKNCDFKAVSAIDHQNESVRDALINGLQSTTIRERLLSQNELTLDEAHELARSLELAHKQAQSYSNNQAISFSAAAAPLQTSTVTPSHSISPDSTPYLSSINSQICYFCGRSRHPRSKCPAREAVCKSTSIKVNGISLQALIDTGSSSSYVTPLVVGKHGWKIYANDSVITMASTSLTCSTRG
ncbi:hypothetical protein T265_10484 [Opisthorchis viverrini]|uniref:Protein-tyrosine phosphatase n=1 Tax=Opisthorchis viverrini TaxID=6198 RepID=A0A074ZD53_OPIVI|nr:hypothetical protein T265_10484 [Opisthorchis viverrini]KER21125.1 hypothetical protein T265_10484 [Opisthorchis viverrini]